MPLLLEPQYDVPVCDAPKPPERLLVMSPEEVSCCAGIIAFGIGRSGHHVRASGWGPAFLDMGSGYDIGESCQDKLIVILVGAPATA